MSDDEDNQASGSRGGPSGEDGLPKATIQKLVNDLMPTDIQCAKDAREVISACCVEFIHLISSEANDACEKDQKKTIAPEHVVSALKALGFDTYIDEVEGVLDEHKEHVKVRTSKQTTASNKNNGMSTEELLAQQELLFAKSRAKYAETGGAAATEEEQ